ncbi:protein MAIN-LIKE 1-like [Gossypium raimondii]|uniref:protein MAIN-LIKE 1-like n=1 Tax=Gossypium raimondii TaxID=29730 RepID=UPI00063AEB40|nr:protein MAIN-LIKE 1-like [Gossypium raimondii]
MATLDGYWVLRSQFHFPKYDRDERIMSYLKLAGFGDVALIQRFDLRANLTSALVERWCTETHTFIMPCGECTITLEDVAMQLRLRVDDAVVMGRRKVFEPSVLCHRLLGRSPSDGEQNFTCLTLAWLRANFKELSSTATEHEVMCAVRAYIMQLIGVIHLKYLPLLKDFSRAGSYSWGSTVLAILYHELCRATKHGVINMVCCQGLLQSWALYRMPFLAAVRHQPYSWPLMSHVFGNWYEPNINHLPLNDRGIHRRQILADAIYCTEHFNPYS